MGHKIKLGQLVIDKVSGLKGYVTSKTETIAGVVQWGIQPKVDPEKMTIPDGTNIDGFMLQVEDKGVSEEIPDEDTDVKVKLGDRVKDTVTELEGITSEKHIFLNGCVFFTVTSNRFDNFGNVIKRTVNHRLLELIEKKPTAKSAEARPSTGGPTRRAPKQ